MSKEFCREFINTSQPRYVFGANAWARSICEAFDIHGVIDDVIEGPSVFGVPVVRSTEALKDSLVVSAVVLGRPLTARNKLNSLGLRNIDYFSVKRRLGLPLPTVLFMDEFSAEHSANDIFYNYLHGVFEDDVSRAVFEKLIKFRLTQDLEYMEGFSDCQYRQYFEDFLGLQENGEVFFDVGCFDGYTTKEFIERCPGYKSISIVEPDSNNLNMIRDSFRSASRISFHECAVGDYTGVASFQSNGSASCLSSSGGMVVPVRRLDDFKEDPPTFIKMDIEGGELGALKGCCSIIRKYKPRLAISVYHRAEDLRTISTYVRSLVPEYKVYLRHYTEGVTETVMFFLP